MKSLSSIKQKKKPFIPIATAIVGLTLLGTAMWYFFFQNKQASSTTNDGVTVIDYNPPTSEEQQATATRKDELIAEDEQKDTPPADTTLGVIISRSFQEAGAFHLRTVISGTSTGECIATFTKTGQPTVTKSFAVTFEATSAFCKDASVPVGDFAVGGTWNISLVVKKDSKQSPAVTGAAEITK